MKRVLLVTLGVLLLGVSVNAQSYHFEEVPAKFQEGFISYFKGSEQHGLSV